MSLRAAAAACRRGVPARAPVRRCARAMTISKRLDAGSSIPDDVPRRRRLAPHAHGAGGGGGQAVPPPGAGGVEVWCASFVRVRCVCVCVRACACVPLITGCVCVCVRSNAAWYACFCDVRGAHAPAPPTCRC